MTTLIHELNVTEENLLRYSCDSIHKHDIGSDQQFYTVWTCVYT